MKLRDWIIYLSALTLTALSNASVSLRDGAPALQLGSMPNVSAEIEHGVVVEKVEKGSAGEKAGIIEGDVLITWIRGESSGAIDSPFDFSEIEIEQKPRGAIVFEGLRGAEKHVWAPGPTSWNVEVRPSFANEFLAVYRECQASTKIGKLKEAAQCWRRAAASSEGAESPWLSPWLFLQAAKASVDARNWDEADIHYQEAVQQGSKAGPAVLTQLLKGWADSFPERDDWKSGEKYYKQAIAESQKLGVENLTVAFNLYSLGYMYWENGDSDEAEEYFRQSLTIRERLAPGSLVAATSLNSLGLIASDKGNLDSAEAYLKQVKIIGDRLAPDTLSAARLLHNLGLIERKRGNLGQAENYFRRGLAIQEKVAPKGSLGVAMALQDVGNVAFNRGDLRAAEEYASRAFGVRKELASRGLNVDSPIAESLVLMGGFALERGDLTSAEERYRGAATSLEKLPPEIMNTADSHNWAMAIIGLGHVAYERGDSVKAEEYIHRALSRLKDSQGDLGIVGALNDLGHIAMKHGDWAKAEEYCRRALTIEQRLAPASVEHTETLAELASIMRGKQRLDDAAQLYEQALLGLESQFARLGGGDDSRSGFRAKHVGYYRDYADLLIAQHRPEAALQVLERSRARTLLESLVGAHVDVRKGVEPSLLALERSLKAEITAKSDRRIRVLTGKHTEQQAVALDSEIERALVRYQEVEGQIRASSPIYAALTQPQPLSTHEIQEQLLDDDMLLLEYLLGQERSYVFAVTRSSLTVYELPKREAVEAEVRHVYDLLTARSRVLRDEGELQRKARWATAEREYPKAAAVLSQMILGPAAAQLKGKRLLIVSDGALAYIPFATLPVPGVDAASGPGVPLVYEHEIVNLPSVSVLAELRSEAKGRKKAPLTVAVLADPVFDKRDARVEEETAARTQAAPATITARDDEQDDQSEVSLSTNLMTRSGDDIGLATDGVLHFQRLPFSRQEAEAIMEVTEPGQGMRALDFHANRLMATGPELSRYRMIHFATHGLLDSEHPELSGLVLSLVDDRGNPQKGFLGLEDIYNLNLPADLVVLSACQTGLGKQIDGEGLIGLTRGFMYAGASRVVASLWNVEDVATADFMGRFYRAILRDGLSPASALRRAQLEMQKQKRWAHPYYWGAFVIHGDWEGK